MADRNDHALARTVPASGDHVSLERSQLENMASNELAKRYNVLSRLGEGGMGEVLLLRDVVIGRDVAMKSVRKDMQASPAARERFLREARVQGQLEHPSIVPVYDLAKDEGDRLYFTMRRVRGRLLDEACRSLTRHALLSAIGRVCLAVDYAHAHGVVHRDLKPSNLMIGDYGEVYVLDWGVAKLPDVDDVGMLGTPGYMPPEQVRGETVDARADVYALGVCLFELLTGEPLHAGASTKSVLDGTLAGVDARVALRARGADVPPELEAICVRATAEDPDDRFPSAREMYDAIERFLEGDRDLERRRVKAEEHAEAAAALAAKKDDETSARASAMREVGRALALAPDNTNAMRTMVRLLTDPPREVPEPVRVEIEAEREARIATARRYGAYAFLSIVPALLLLLWMGLREPLVLYGALASAIGSALVLAAPRHLVPKNRHYVVAALGFLGLALSTRVVGPFVGVPVVASGLAAGLMLSPRHVPVWLAAGGAWACVLGPLLLERFGLTSPSYVFGPEQMCIPARAAGFPEAPTLVYLVFVTLLPVPAVCTYLARIRERLADAEQRVRVHAWQLRQIVPEE
jgi:serine/threonine-protein kinase